MTNPIKVDTSTSPDSIKQMTDAEMDYTVHRILTAFASSDTGVGTLSVNPVSTAGLTAIGSFADNYTDPVGTHPTTTVYTTTYTFYQDLQVETETFTRPLFVDTTTTPDSLKEQTDTELNATIISRALANLVSQGVGSYYLGATAPAGGTWVVKETVPGYTDSSTSVPFYLWRKTVPAAVPATIRPLKADTTTTPDSLKEMTDAELNDLVDRLRNRIVATGVGYYNLVTGTPPTVPTPGTWVEAGDVTDIRRDFAVVGYGASFLGNYSGNYTGTFSGNYTGPTYYSGFAGAPTKAYTGNYSKAFSGTYTGTYGSVYSGSTVQSATVSALARTLFIRTA